MTQMILMRQTNVSGRESSRHVNTMYEVHNIPQLMLPLLLYLTLPLFTDWLHTLQHVEPDCPVSSTTV